MSHFFGVTTHGYDYPVGSAVCDRILSEYHTRNTEPSKYHACDLGRTAAVFPDRDLRQADVLYGSNDGYSYGSNKRVSLMRRRSMPPAETPRDTYRLPLLTNMQYHWFSGDPALGADYDPERPGLPFGECQVSRRSYAAPRVAGLMNKEVDMVIRLQERGLIRRVSDRADSQGPPGSVIPQGWVKTAGAQGSGGASQGSGGGAEDSPAMRAPAEPERSAGEEETLVGMPTGPREVCEKKRTSHPWHLHRHRHPQFYSAMTRFVETVRINDKLFEMY